MQNLMTMNNHAPKGTAVTVVHENGEVQNGHSSDKELVKEHLLLDHTYHVDRTHVGDWTTKVYLEEVPDIAFNSVNFKEIKL